MLNVNDGTLDAFVLDYCAAHNIICDGDAFGLVFSGKDTFTEAEVVDLIEQGVRTYGLRFDHVITLPDMVAWEAFAAANAAVERAERCPSEANLNGAHNLFYSIAMTGKA